ncbi:MAG: ester cyclase [Parachlamydia sp.]|nr:ester cyclase [Parachlamydia sp.]
MYNKKSAVEHIIHEFLGKGNLSLYEQLIAKNVKIHCPPSWQKLHAPSVKGREIARQLDREYATAFAMNKIEISDLISDQDKILARWSCEGIHTKDLFNLKATQRRFHLTGQTLYQFNNVETQMAT